jgi:hypothetical protein
VLWQQERPVRYLQRIAEQDSRLAAMQNRSCINCP